MCGDALKSEIVFQEKSADETHTCHIAGETTFPDPETGGDAGAVWPRARTRLHPAPALSFETVISLLFTMSKNSIGKALIEGFKNRKRTPSVSEFVQQREKLLPAALEKRFQRFTACLYPAGHFQGYRLLAVDGSDLKSAAYPRDPTSYRPGAERQSVRLESLALEYAL